MDGVMKRDSLMHLPHVALAHKPPAVKLEGEMGRVNREKPFMLRIMESKNRFCVGINRTGTLGRRLQDGVLNVMVARESQHNAI